MCRSCSEIHSPMRYEVTISKISGLRRPGARPPGPPGSINCLTSHLKYLFDTLRGTRAPRSAPGMAQPQTPSGCGSRQDRPVACLSSCDEALLPATRWRCPEERPTPATPCRWFRRKLCGELFVFCLNKIPSKPHFFDSGEYEKRCLRKSISRRSFLPFSY